jgi:hypothetical protein
VPAEAYEAKVKVYAGGAAAEGVAALAAGRNRIALDLRRWRGLAAVDRVKVWVRADGNDDWRGSFTLDEVAFARDIVSEARANLRLEASATSLRPGAPITVEVANHDARTLRGEIRLRPTESLRVTPDRLHVDGIATGELRRFTLRIEAAAGSAPRLRYRYRGHDAERRVALPAGGIVLYDFEDGTEGWVAGENVAAVSRADRFANAPASPRLGRFVLAAQGDAVPADAWRTVRVEAPEGIDLRAGPFFAHVNGYGGVPGASYEARIELTSSASGAVLTRTVRVSPDSWNRIEVDTAGWPGAGNVTGIAISYRAAGSTMVWSSQFQVDYVGFEKGAEGPSYTDAGDHSSGPPAKRARMAVNPRQSAAIAAISGTS